MGELMDEIGETELVDNGRVGMVLNGGDGAVRRMVDAGLVRRCCHELKDQIDPRGVRLRNAVITGCLDLAGLYVPFPLRFEACDFEQAPIVEGAQLHELAFTGCGRLPGLLANGVRIRRDLDLSRSHVKGGHETSASTSSKSAIWLCQSEIGGCLLCVDTTIDGNGGRSLHGDRIQVGGTARFIHSFTAQGDMRLLGARIGGSLDLAGARIEALSSGRALNLNDATIGGGLFLTTDPTGRRPVIQGLIDMTSARISGQLLIRNATLNEPGITPAVSSGYSTSRQDGTAFLAPRLSVGAEIALEGHCRVTGGIDLSMSDASSISIGDNSSLHAPGRTALDLTNAELRSSLTLSEGVTVEGTIRLTGTHINGNLSLQGPTLSDAASWPHTRHGEIKTLIAGEGARVDGDVDMRNLRASGGALRFRNAMLGGIVHADGAHLTNPGGYTLNLHQATIMGSTRLGEGFESHGLVVLNRTTIEGRLECTGGSFTGGPLPGNPRRDHAIEAISATIQGGMDLGWASVTPSVDLTNATTTFLADSPDNWPTRFIISGFSYDRFQQPQGTSAGRTWDQAARCAWLSRQAAYDAGPYEQAARVYREHGYTSQAEQILITQRRQARRATGGRGALVRRGLDAAYGASVGYGYRPGRVLWLLAALLVLVTASLELPAGQATMRATTSTGSVYTTKGPLPTASEASTPGPPPAPHLATPTVTATQGSDPCGDGQVRCFSPALYAVDTVIPLVSLDQRSTWYPDSHARDGSLMEWWLNIATLLGWLLSSIFVLSFARLARAA
jgi:hypothetical protein